jgi:ABC-type polysaccharide/polyol phosphate transport system ATPase subunit
MTAGTLIQSQPSPAGNVDAWESAVPDRNVAVWMSGVTLRYRRMRRQPTKVKDVAIHLVTGKFGFDTIEALRDVSFRVRRGEVLGVIGPNGAGKSTLLKVLARVLAPTAGRVIVRGRAAPMIELGAGFDSELTARENIVLCGALLGRSPRLLRERVQPIAEWAGLEAVLGEPLRTFSSGMLARLAFSIAVDCDPEVLLVDEVLAVGDAAFQARSLERMRQLIQGGSAVVLVSHAGQVIRQLAHRALWLDYGRVVACGDPGSVTAAYEAAALTGGVAIRVSR